MYIYPAKLFATTEEEKNIAALLDSFEANQEIACNILRHKRESTNLYGWLIYKLIRSDTHNRIIHEFLVDVLTDKQKEILLLFQTHCPRKNTQTLLRKFKTDQVVQIESSSISNIDFHDPEIKWIFDALLPVVISGHIVLDKLSESVLKTGIDTLESFRKIIVVNAVLHQYESVRLAFSTYNILPYRENDLKLISMILEKGNKKFTHYEFSLEREWIQTVIHYIVEIGNWYPVKILNLSNLALKHIDFVRAFPLLEKLVLRNNQIVDFSPVLRLPNLRTLNVSGNPITELPPEFATMNLDQLFATQLKRIPEGMQVRSAKLNLEVTRE